MVTTRVISTSPVGCLKSLQGWAVSIKVMLHPFKLENGDQYPDGLRQSPTRKVKEMLGVVLLNAIGLILLILYVVGGYALALGIAGLGIMIQSGIYLIGYTYRQVKYDK